MYKLQRAGYDWGGKLRSGFIALGWNWLRDVGETSLFARGDVLAAVYTDDVKFGGPAQQVDEAFGFSKKSKQLGRDEAFVGLEAEWLP